MINKFTVTSFRSKSGAMVRIRPLQATDTPLLIDIFKHMSSESRYQRFQQTLDHLSEERIHHEAAQIAEADPAVNFGLIAFTAMPSQANVPIGAARWVEIELGEAEIAISIRDDFHNQGIGTQLLRLLTDQAKQAGYNYLTAEIRNENPAIWHILANLPYQVTHIPNDGESNVVINLQ